MPKGTQVLTVPNKTVVITCTGKNSVACPGVNLATLPKKTTFYYLFKRGTFKGDRYSPYPQLTGNELKLKIEVIDEGAVIKQGARILPYAVIGRQTHVEEGASVEASIVWPNGWIGPDASIKGSILGRNCHVGRSAVIESPAVLGDKTVITDYSKL